MVLAASANMRADLQLSQNQLNPVVNQPISFLGIEPIVPIDPPELGYEPVEHTLDQDDGANGWSLSNPPPLFNIFKLGYCPEYDIIWDLNTQTGIEPLSNFMLNHKMTAIHFHYKGEFLKETSPNSNSYYGTIEEVEFFGWVSGQGIFEYFNFASVKVNGISKPNFYGSIKTYDIITQIMNTYGMSYGEAAFNFGLVMGPIGLALCGASWFLIKLVWGAAACFMVIAGWIAGVVAGLIGVAIIIAVIYFAISAFIRREA